MASWGSSWGVPFYSGGGASSAVPGRFMLAIAGMPFMLDTRGEAVSVNGDIAVQRPQADTEGSPGENTLSTEGLWRRTIRSWHLGSGQEFYDDPDSNRFRYHTSTGVDPWERKKLQLLPTTALSLASGNTNLRLAVAADRLYALDGQTVRYTTDLTTWTAITGTPGATALSIASDGSTVYVAYGASGVYSVAAGAGAAAVYAPGAASAVGYAKGRLLVVETSGANPRVYNVTAAGAITGGTLLLTVPGLVVEPGQWTAEGNVSIYLIGYVGDKSRIWRTAVKPDGTALDVPTIAGQLPDGQQARSIVSYLGSVVLIGTDDRVWTLAPVSEGNLETTGNFDSAGQVLAFEPQDRFVWYGDGSALGRIDLGTDVTDDASDFVPARASDLVPGLSGAVQSVATYGGRRVFGVSGRGVYAESATAKVASGVIELGAITWGIGDPKNAFFADIRHEALQAGDSIVVEAAADDGPYTVVGISTVVGEVARTVQLGELIARSVRLRLTLAGDPVLVEVTLRAAPAPTTGELWQFPLLLFRRVSNLVGDVVTQDVLAAREYLRALRSTRQAVVVQHGSYVFTGIIDRLAEWREEKRADDDAGVWTGVWDGVQVVVVKTVEVG